MEVKLSALKGNVIHDFPYLPVQRKCPHVALISITHSGGCIHKCPMCYARAYPWSVEDELIVYKNVPEKLEKEICEAKILPPFYISQVSDALQPVREVREITFKVIKIIIKYKLSFHILTKSAQGAISLIEAIPELIHYPYWYLAMTVESPPEKQEITSPYASKIDERLEALKKLNLHGIPIVGRVDPTILGFVEPEEVCWLIKRLADCGVQHIIGSLGYYNSLSIGRLITALYHSKWKDCIPKVEKVYGCKFDSIDTYPSGLSPQGQSPEPFTCHSEPFTCHSEPFTCHCERERSNLVQGRRKRFRASISTRVKFHSLLRKETEKYGLTYAVCLELPKEYDSRGIPSCEGMRNNFIHLKREDGTFHPINCYADCLRSCPDENNPPCGKTELKTQYPYKLRTLKRIFI